MNGIVRHIKSGVLYEYLGENKFRNLATGNEGVVEEEKAAEIFVLNLEATQLLNEYPPIKELITKLKLKLDK